MAVSDYLQDESGHREQQQYLHEGAEAPTGDYPEKPDRQQADKQNPKHGEAPILRKSCL